MQLKTLSRLRLCRKIRLDLWGDVLFSNRKIRLFRKFKKRRIIRRRKPGRLAKSYKSRRLLYLLRHHRAFLNWFKNSKHLSSDIRVYRKLTLTSFKKRIYSNSRVNLTALFKSGLNSRGADVDPSRIAFFNNVSSNMRDNFVLNTFEDEKVRSTYQSMVEEERRAVRRGMQGFTPNVAKMKFRFSRMKEVRDRVTRRWPRFKKTRWNNRQARLLDSPRKRINRAYTIFSPRVSILSKVYMNIFDELKTTTPSDVYKGGYSKFIKLRSPSWFIDSSKNYFANFKRKFFIGYLYFSKPSSSYFSSIYDYLSNYGSSSVYSKSFLNTFFLKRRLSSNRPSRRPELLFNSILKRSKYGNVKDGKMALFEVRRKDFLLNQFYRRLTRKKPVSVFSSGLQDFIPTRPPKKIGLKDTYKFKFFRPIGSKSLDAISTKRTRGLGSKIRTTSFRIKRKKFGFKKFRGLPKLYRGSVFTKKAYMDILLNRNKQFRKKRKSVYRHDMLAKRRLKIFYGFLAEASFKSLFKFYTQQSNEFFFKFVRSLESRAYMVLFRSGLFTSVKTAKQLILHSHIWVNDNRISDFNYLIKQGDVITFKPSISLLGFKKLKLSWANRKVIPSSNLLISYKLPAIVMAESYAGIQDFKFNFPVSSRKLNRFYKV